MPNTLLILITILVATVAGALWAVQDFSRWKSLGPGGLPHSPSGWLMMSFLRLLKRDGRSSKRLALALKSDESNYLGNLVRRQARRPIVAAQPIPQRQLTDLIASEDLVRLKALFDAAVESHRDVVHYAQSFFEKHNDAITLKHPECGHVFALVSNGEIAHIHPTDGSMHMVLSPIDAKMVLESQWGELHALAGLFGRLPVSYTFIYAPRNEADFDTMRKILSASLAFMVKRE